MHRSGRRRGGDPITFISFLDHIRSVVFVGGDAHADTHGETRRRAGGLVAYWSRNSGPFFFQLTSGVVFTRELGYCGTFIPFLRILGSFPRQTMHCLPPQALPSLLTHHCRGTCLCNFQVPTPSVSPAIPSQRHVKPFVNCSTIPHHPSSSSSHSIASFSVLSNLFCTEGRS